MLLPFTLTVTVKLKCLGKFLNENTNNTITVIKTVRALTFSGCCCNVSLTTAVYFIALSSEQSMSDPINRSYGGKRI